MKGSMVLSLGYLLVACCVMTAVRGGTLECRQEGRFPHPQNCDNYVDCYRTADGVLMAREGNCHGYPFSAEKRKCVDHSEKPECVIKGIRNSFPASDFNHLCAEDGANAGCVNCKLAFFCINGIAMIDVCDVSSVCGNTLEAFGYSVCLPPSSFGNDDKCSCNNVGLVTDPFNSTFFHYCGIGTDLPEIFSCDAGSTFNDVTMECEVSGPPETPSCEGQFGTFVNPNDCSWSYSCLPGGIVRTSSCTGDEYYEEGACKKKCMFGEVKPIEDCTDLGFLIFDNDCTKYLSCKEIGKPPIVEFCDQGFFFNESTKRCSDTTLPQRCEAQGGFDYLSCPGHENVISPCTPP